MTHDLRPLPLARWLAAPATVPADYDPPDGWPARTHSAGAEPAAV